MSETQLWTQQGRSLLLQFAVDKPVKSGRRSLNRPCVGGGEFWLEGLFRGEQHNMFAFR